MNIKLFISPYIIIFYITFKLLLSFINILAPDRIKFAIGLFGRANENEEEFGENESNYWDTNDSFFIYSASIRATNYYENDSAVNIAWGDNL